MVSTGAGVVVDGAEALAANGIGDVHGGIHVGRSLSVVRVVATSASGGLGAIATVTAQGVSA
jgi:hypothetical protein